MKRIPLLIGLILISFALFPQSYYKVTGSIRGLTLKKVYISAVYGDKIPILDSTVTDEKGNFIVKVRMDKPAGLYRCWWDKEKSVDLIINKEDVSFQTIVEEPGDSMDILSSVENKLYYWSMQRDRTNQARLSLLMPVVEYYPVKDDFYRQVTTEYEGIQKAQEKIVDSLAKLYLGSFAVHIWKLQQTPFLPSTLSKEESVNYMKAHFFDNIDFTDTLLLHSNAWSNKAISYLGLWGNSRLSQKQLGGEFIKAVTAMLSAASVNAEVYKFLLDYFLGGFDKYHFDDVITYMADHFQDPFSCEDAAKKTSLQKKLETFKKISVGKVAPDIEVPDMTGKPVKLSGIKSEYTLLIFWSSECGHCTQMMPKVKDIYDKQKPKRYEIFAVSIDTSRSEWTTFIKDEKLKWLNASDLKGFDSKAADSYNIYATPTMFLLDADKKILAKPISWKELEQNLKDFKLL
ncbi:MAG: redoxin domain-containing protein [Bacteroidetes bacterium]|nr:redoxin domain-containing protein [Bacteroidota bacterium]